MSITIEHTNYPHIYNIVIHTTFGGYITVTATIDELIELWKELGNIVLVETLKERIYSDNMKVSTRWDREKLVMQLIIERNNKKKLISNMKVLYRDPRVS